MPAKPSIEPAFPDVLEAAQIAICQQYKSPYSPAAAAAAADSMLGISKNVLDGLAPTNGLRHPAESGTCGWFIWAGTELKDDNDFFVPLHVAHVSDWCPEALPYLGLAPGWRFLIDGDYVDVWFDEALLVV